MQGRILLARLTYARPLRSVTWLCMARPDNVAGEQLELGELL